MDKFSKVSKEWIKSMEASGVKVMLICRSANRSQNVKKLYFSTNENIVSLDGGITNPGIKIKKVNSWGFGIQQILQLVFAVILTCLSNSFVLFTNQQIAVCNDGCDFFYIIPDCF